MDGEAGFDPNKMRYSAAHLQVGRRVRLFSIDEESDEESARFTALVTGVSIDPTPIARFKADFAQEGEAVRVSEILSGVLEAGEAYLHIELVEHRGSSIRMFSPPIAIELLDPGNGQDTFTPELVPASEVNDALSRFEIRFVGAILE